ACWRGQSDRVAISGISLRSGCALRSRAQRALGVLPASRRREHDSSHSIERRRDVWSARDGRARRESHDRITVGGLTRSPPEAVNLVQNGVSAWHLDVQWIPSRNEFWMLFNGKTPGDCTTPAL